MADLFAQRQWRQAGFIGESLDNFSTRQRYEAFVAHTQGMEVAAHFDSSGYQAGFAAARRCLPRIRSCRRCSAPPICWRSARWTACGRTTPAASLPAIIGFDDIPRRTGSPIS